MTTYTIFYTDANGKSGAIEYSDYYAGVLQINPREFRLLSRSPFYQTGWFF